MKKGDEDLIEDDFPKFEKSTLYKELEKKYNIIILDFEDNKLSKVVFPDFTKAK